MTQQDCLGKVRIRLGRFDSAYSLDEQFILTQINLARRDVCLRLLPYKRDWFAFSELSINDGDVLPYDLLGTRPRRVMLDGKEARYFTPQEFYFGADGGGIAQANTDSPGTDAFPVYSIWGDGANNRVFFTAPAGKSGTIDYFKGVSDLAVDQTDYAVEVGMPTGYDVAVELGALWRCLVKVNDKDNLASTFKQYLSVFSSIEGQDAVQKYSRRMSMQAIPLPAGGQQQQIPSGDSN
jgi:hypothetical protein